MSSTLARAAGIMAGMSFGVSKASTARVSIALAGPWWFRQTGGAGEGGPDARPAADWMPATVPGCVHTDLLAAGTIADPFAGTNEKDQQWIERAGWEYQTSFVADEALLARQRVDLDFAGLDTYAEVLLNGTPVLSADNMFRSWRVDVKPHLRPGTNALVVRFASPVTQVMPAYEGLGYVLPAANDQATPMVSMFTRKAPYHYGWDWGPRFVTSGIWRPARLEAWDTARIDDLQIVQTELTDARAKLLVKVTVVAARRGRARVAVTLGDGDRGAAGAAAGEGAAVGEGAPAGEIDATLEIGPNQLQTEVTIDDPRRWWPNGLGQAHLYTVGASLSVDGIPRDQGRRRIGLRTLAVVHRADQDGKSFTIDVNGAPVFMKGANYIPSDSFLPRITDQRYRQLVQSAADANMNMLRVWGGGIYEDDRFYDLCDELGILVWQDFMFACSMYPGDARFIESVRQEAIENVRRLRNHPSLALWAGNNEMEAAWAEWGWQEKFQLTKAAQQKIWGDYQRIFHQLLPQVVAENDPGRFYTRSSPSANDDTLPANKLGFGDMHYWGVWHAEAPYQKYAENTSRFMSEYGFQSFPELATVARYAAPADFRIDSPVMLSHQRHPRGNQLVRTYMDRDFRAPKDFASFLYVSQVLQATVIQYAAEAHRRRMPYCAGSLYWQLDDCWPVASWSGIDYFGRWKALHHFARRFFAPVLASVVEEGGAGAEVVRVYAISDRRSVTPARLVLRLIDFSGRELWRQESEVRLAANASQVYFSAARKELLGQPGAKADRVVLAVELFDGGGPRIGRSLHYFVASKDLALPAPELGVALAPRGDGEATVRVTARQLARHVRLESDLAGGAFSDNYFDLLPGETVTIELNGPPATDDAKADARFTAASTFNAQVNALSLRDTY